MIVQWFFTRTTGRLTRDINLVLIDMSKRKKVPFFKVIDDKFTKMGASKMLEVFTLPVRRGIYNEVLKEIEETRQKAELTRYEKGLIQGQVVIERYLAHETLGQKIPRLLLAGVSISVWAWRDLKIKVANKFKRGEK